MVYKQKQMSSILLCRLRLTVQDEMKHRGFESIHHFNKTAFSIAFSAFSRIFCQSRRPNPPTPSLKGLQLLGQARPLNLCAAHAPHKVLPH